MSNRVVVRTGGARGCKSEWGMMGEKGWQYSCFTRCGVRNVDFYEILPGESSP